MLTAIRTATLVLWKSKSLNTATQSLAPFRCTRYVLPASSPTNPYAFRFVSNPPEPPTKALLPCKASSSHRQNRKFTPTDDKLISQITKLTGAERVAERNRVATHLERSISSVLGRLKYLGILSNPSHRVGKYHEAEDNYIRGVAKDCLAAEQKISWTVIGEVLGRRGASVQARWDNVLANQIVKGDWTREEDAIIRESCLQASADGRDFDWTGLTVRLRRGRSRIITRWHNVLNPTITRKGKWAEWEDRILSAEVSAAAFEERRINYNEVGNAVCRTATACKIRWEHGLDPELKHGRYTVVEDEIIMRGQKNLLTWKELGKILNRSSNAVRERYLKLIRKAEQVKQKK
ncbi:Myblike DNAbinding domain-containing protein [Rhizophlyctis rosea]|uniref:Myblike DNAbinding domain-containing protein n=1 Tax=Rhizophlyctis rosea TaxID=64517 RepID=A0AAD5X888_9FUNG|nr:Myblike DNAbinding domain-containing protein [Rhizophlyctis rosea]